MRTKLIFYLILSVLAVILCLAWNLTPTKTLILVHIIFRHGDRTPIQLPNINTSRLYSESSLSPYGAAELTLKGKRRLYRVGKALRERYSSFLGDLYFDDVLEASSSSYTRTVASLQCVLAAMFPPRKEWEVEDGLMWQPAYFTQIPSEEDKIIATFNCNKISEAGIVLSRKNAATLKHVEETIGKKFTNFLYFMNFENTLQVMEELGLDVPAWTQPIRSKMRELYSEIFRETVLNSLPLVSGKLLQKINGDTVQKINGNLPLKKLFVYAGHDMNVLGLLFAIGAYKKQNLDYGCYIAIEVHEINEMHGVKIFFGGENPAAAKPLWIENCGYFCPLDKFIDLTSKLYPPEPWCS